MANRTTLIAAVLPAGVVSTLTIFCLRTQLPGEHQHFLCGLLNSYVLNAVARMLMTVLLAFGALAGVLAAIGVYGLFSWSVALRRRELAIRLTLGASPGGVGGLVLRQGAILVTAGLVCGWIIVRLAEGALARVLFGVTASDLTATVLASAVLLLATLAACLPAAARAMRVDPVEGLRAE